MRVWGWDNCCREALEDLEGGPPDLAAGPPAVGVDVLLAFDTAFLLRAFLLEGGGADDDAEGSMPVFPPFFLPASSFRLASRAAFRMMATFSLTAAFSLIAFFSAFSASRSGVVLGCGTG